MAEWAVGLIVIVFLWDRRSSAYFAELQRARQQATPQWRAGTALTGPGRASRRPGPTADPEGGRGARQATSPPRERPEVLTRQVIPCNGL